MKKLLSIVLCVVILTCVCGAALAGTETCPLSDLPRLIGALETENNDIINDLDSLYTYAQGKFSGGRPAYTQFELEILANEIKAQKEDWGIKYKQLQETLDSFKKWNEYDKETRLKTVEDCIDDTEDLIDVCKGINILHLANTWKAPATKTKNLLFKDISKPLGAYLVENS